MKVKATQQSRCYIGARIPADVKDKLDRKSKRERRSLSATIELILIQAASLEP